MWRRQLLPHLRIRFGKNSDAKQEPIKNSDRTPKKKTRKNRIKIHDAIAMMLS